ncbi:MAG: hypothetical protein IPK24_07575 [Kineosporiaceae bacterium]|nr:hypothetical protein [Kineosporiaceae bacterium]
MQLLAAMFGPTSIILVVYVFVTAFKAWVDGVRSLGQALSRFRFWALRGSEYIQDRGRQSVLGAVAVTLGAVVIQGSWVLLVAIVGSAESAYRQQEQPSMIGANALHPSRWDAYTVATVVAAAAALALSYLPEHWRSRPGMYESTDATAWGRFYFFSWTAAIGLPILAALFCGLGYVAGLSFDLITQATDTAPDVARDYPILGVVALCGLAFLVSTMIAASSTSLVRSQWTDIV